MTSRPGWLFAGLLALSGPTGTSAERVADSLSSKDRAALQSIGEAAERQDCAPILKDAGRLVQDRGAALPAQVHADLHHMLWLCEAQAGREERAYAHALNGTRLAESHDDLWHGRFGHELGGKKHEVAAKTLLAMSQGHGRAMNSVPMSWVWQLLRGLEDGDAQQVRMQLLALLASDAYAPVEAAGENDGFRLHYARALLAAGQEAKLGDVVSRLQTPAAIAAASVEPGLSRHLRQADVRAAAEATLQRVTDASAREPNRLGHIIERAALLRQLGRAEEAITLLNTAVPRLNEPDGFVDKDEQGNWLWDALGRSQAMLGRYEESTEAFRKGMALGEDGGAGNVSQTINLAQSQVTFGRPAEALATLAAFDPAKKGGASEYGLMQYRWTRACALALAGRSAEAAGDVAFVKANAADSRQAVTDMHLCMGDLDGAAASLIRSLEDPKERARAVLRLSDYDPLPVPMPMDVIARNFEKVKARADVKAALARAGGARRFAVQKDEL